MARIHILGASGSGTTTLGIAVADELGVPHWDTDDFFWLPSDPPFTKPRPPAERLSLLLQSLSASASWVLSGSALNWGESLAHLYDLVVFVTLDPAVRMERLRQRERGRYGSRIEPGGDMAETSAAFLAWAATYDTAGLTGRSRAVHEAWLATLEVPVIRLDSAEPLETLKAAVLSAAAGEAGSGQAADGGLAGEAQG